MQIERAVREGTEGFGVLTDIVSAWAVADETLSLGRLWPATS